MSTYPEKLQPCKETLKCDHSQGKKAENKNDCPVGPVIGFNGYFRAFFMNVFKKLKRNMFKELPENKITRIREFQ